MGLLLLICIETYITCDCTVCMCGGVKALVSTFGPALVLLDFLKAQAPSWVIDLKV